MMDQLALALRTATPQFGVRPLTTHWSDRAAQAGTGGGLNHYDTSAATGLGERSGGGEPDTMDWVARRYS